MSDPRPGETLDWTDDGQPRSRLYGDIYFSTEDGLAESRAVFLQGCGLPDAWARRDRFVVGELGFGSGLNILALLHLWRETRPPGAHLHIFTVEAHPLRAEEARRALSAWPELADLAALLTNRWPGAAHGFHRIDLPELGVVIDVAVMEAGEALAAWSGQADAWFLDGFSPALNPAMWREALMQAVAQRTRPGGRAATFTVAGQVRRALAAAGFSVAKQPGYGRKRERLEAFLPGPARSPASSRRIAIVGGGIAGASLARAVRALGAEALVIECDGLGAGASGNPSALVTPRLDAGLDAPARLFAQAFARAVRLYEDLPGAVLSRGVLQLAAMPRDPGRFATIAGADLFEPGVLARLTPEATSTRLGEPAPEALLNTAALVIRPRLVLEAWAGGILRAEAAALEHDGGAWTIHDAGGGVIAKADAVILAAGWGAARLADLPLAPVRGQASWTTAASGIPAAAWGGYLAPTDAGLLFGATHDRGDEGFDVRPADHERNLRTLETRLPRLGARLRDAPLEGRASVRAVTPDRLPLAGAAPDGGKGLFVLGGLGSRGFTLAPLLAEHVAALALGTPSPLPTPLGALVDPARFARRAARRGHSTSRE